MGRTIAFGDIHGCTAALNAVLDAIEPTGDDTLIPLGDFVDRGPDTRGTLDRLIQLKREFQVIPLRGNHEAMLLAARESPLEQHGWLGVGGAQTLASYGFDRAESIPDTHIEFILWCLDYYETDTHFFIHANYLADSPLDEQPEWVARWESLHTHVPRPHMSGKTAVVGHTAQRSGEILDLGHVICLDTDCSAGGWLSAMDVESGQIWQANRQGRLRQ